MIGWVDGRAGASGDMLLGALVDVGVPLMVLQDAVDGLGLGITLTAQDVTRQGIGATKVDVHASDDGVSRSWAQVQTMVTGRAYAVLARLAQAEARVHRVAVEDVHFHEVGAHDSLADVVAVCAGLEHLGLSELHCSTLALGSGQARGAHGPIPVPGPAVLELLRGVPVEAGPSPYEATTPTGAALLAEHVTTWGPLPTMTVTRTGSGAGSRDPEGVANVLRLVLGQGATSEDASVVLACNVDDLDPRQWPHVLEQLMAHGASDAWLTPILMKKGRPAYTLSVLCTTDLTAALKRVVFTETTTIGLRETAVTKTALDRTERTVDIGGQPIRVKTSWLDGEPVNVMPEWEDVRAAAAALGRSLQGVYAAARSSS